MPRGTIRRAAATGELPGFPAGEVDALTAAEILEDRFTRYSEMLSEGIAAIEGVDPTTQDLMIEVQREVGRQAWFLRAHRR